MTCLGDRFRYEYGQGTTQSCGPRVLVHLLLHANLLALTLAMPPESFGRHGDSLHSRVFRQFAHDAVRGILNLSEQCRGDFPHVGTQSPKSRADPISP